MNKLTIYLLVFCNVVVGSDLLAQDFWQQSNGPYDELGSYVRVNELLISTTGVVLAGTNTGIFRSSDNGVSWSRRTDIMPYCIDQVSDGTIYAGDMQGNGVYYSTDQGLNWGVKTSLFNYVFAVASNTKGDLFVGTGKGLFRSSDKGSSWKKIFPGPMDTAVYEIVILENEDILIGVYSNNCVQRSTDNGDTWTSAQGLPMPLAKEIVVNNETGSLYCVGNGIFRSTNGGISWQPINDKLDEGATTYTLTLNSLGHIFAGGVNGVFFSTDDGINWSRLNTGLTDSGNVSRIRCAPNGYLFAGTYGYAVFKSASPTSSIKRVDNSNELQLEQNSPNPFCEATTIMFSLPQTGFTSLRVYDLLGVEKKVLVSEVLSIGTYEVVLNNADLSEGIYIYTLEAAGVRSTKKLVLKK
jgi:ligand-binding sensor domain-containing protein